jgi:hypothetical protein
MATAAPVRRGSNTQHIGTALQYLVYQQPRLYYFYDY